MEAGNQRLISRQREILAAELMKEDLLRQILVLRDQVTELTHKGLILQQRYEQEAAKMRGSLNGLRRQITEAVVIQVEL